MNRSVDTVVYVRLESATFSLGANFELQIFGISLEALE